MPFSLVRQVQFEKNPGTMRHRLLKHEGRKGPKVRDVYIFENEDGRQEKSLSLTEDLSHRHGCIFQGGVDSPC